MRIDVTQEDIDQGERDQCHNYPIARALNRTVPGSRWSVDSDWCHMHAGPEELLGSYELPEVAQDFIATFDHGDDDEEVTPFSFELDI